MASDLFNLRFYLEPLKILRNTPCFGEMFFRSQENDSFTWKLPQADVKVFDILPNRCNNKIFLHYGPLFNTKGQVLLYKTIDSALSLFIPHRLCRKSRFARLGPAQLLLLHRGCCVPEGGYPPQRTRFILDGVSQKGT